MSLFKEWVKIFTFSKGVGGGNPFLVELYGVENIYYEFYLFESSLHQTTKL